MAALRGSIILLMSFFGLYKGFSAWVGHGIAPATGLRRPAAVMQQSRGMSARNAIQDQKIKVGDVVHYKWVRPTTLTKTVELGLGDYGIVEGFAPEFDSIKVRLQGKHGGYVGYVLGASVHKETLADAAFRVLDADCNAFLTKQEAAPLLGEKFDKVDLDKNGRIDKSEWIYAKLDEAACRKLVDSATLA